MVKKIFLLVKLSITPSIGRHFKTSFENSLISTECSSNITLPSTYISPASPSIYCNFACGYWLHVGHSNN